MIGGNAFVRVAGWLLDDALGTEESSGNEANTGSKSCFPAGTPVHIAEGVKAIEKIVAGDRVWSYDHRELRWAEGEVVEVYQLLHRGTMATLQVQGETLRATGGHPFWVVSGEGWPNGLDRSGSTLTLPAADREADGRWRCDLRAGDELLLRQLGVVALESVRLDEVEERVYNFHVAELQNYAVGVWGVLVHNTNDPPDNADNPTPDSGPKDLANQARQLQQDIDDLKDAIRQAHQQHLDPKHIEPMNEMLARLLRELTDLFK